MSKEEMVQAIKTEVEHITKKKSNILCVRKNNGVERTGLALRQDNDGVSTIAYIDDAVDRAISGELSVQEVAEEVVGDLGRKINDVTLDVKNFVDKEYTLRNVTLFLVSGDSNEAMKADVPHRDFLDLTVFYRVVISRENPEYVMSYIITNESAEGVGATEQELFDAAVANTAKDGYEIMTLNGMIAVLTGRKADEPAPEDIGLFVMTTKDRMWGASVLMHTDYLKAVAEKVGSDFYILPSSIHEVITAPVGYGELDAFKEMVRAINATVVSPEDILSDNVYLFSKDNSTLTIV